MASAIRAKNEAEQGFQEAKRELEDMAQTNETLKEQLLTHVALNDETSEQLSHVERALAESKKTSEKEVEILHRKLVDAFCRLAASEETARRLEVQKLHAAAQTSLLEQTNKHLTEENSQLVQQVNSLNRSIQEKLQADTTLEMETIREKLKSFQAASKEIPLQNGNSSTLVNQNNSSTSVNQNLMLKSNSSEDLAFDFSDKNANQRHSRSDFSLNKTKADKRPEESDVGNLHQNFVENVHRNSTKHGSRIHSSGDFDTPSIERISAAEVRHMDMEVSKLENIEKVMLDFLAKTENFDSSVHDVSVSLTSVHIYLYCT